jgi:hypothetical protein
MNYLLSRFLTSTRTSAVHLPRLLQAQEKIIRRGLENICITDLQLKYTLFSKIREVKVSGGRKRARTIL